MTDNSRRSFVRKLGTGVSAALVSAAGSADAAPRTEDDPALRALLLEEEKAIRQLHQAFEQAQDKELHDEVIGMFAEDAEVVFNGGLFRYRRGVTRLYRERFRAGRSGRRMEPAPGFELAAGPQQESVQVAADRLSASGVFPYSIQVGSPFETGNSLADMARLHGEGVRTWWEGGEYHVAYRKDIASGRWTISRLDYRTLARADYRPGRTYAEPLTVAPFRARFPGDQLGPDDLV